MPVKYQTFQELEEKEFSHTNKLCHGGENIYIGEYKYNIDMTITLEMEKKIRKIIKDEFEKLKRNAETYRILNDLNAKKEIINLLKKYKKNGENQINILNIGYKLKLPIEQVDKILDNLKEEDIIRDIE